MDSVRGASRMSPESVPPVRRISPLEFMRRREGAILVSGYDSEPAFLATRLPGALSYIEYLRRRDSLSRDQETVFY